MTLDELPAQPQSATMLCHKARAPSWIEGAGRSNNEDGPLLQSGDTTAALGELGRERANSQAYIGIITYVIIWPNHMLIPKSS